MKSGHSRVPPCRSWSGVLQVSDLPCREQQLSWPTGLLTGRIMVAQHFHESTTPLTVATVYGYPQGPTWPDARSKTDSLLSTLTREVVIGSHGFRVICGDFNHDLDCLQECSIWRAQGLKPRTSLPGIGTRPQCRLAKMPHAVTFCGFPRRQPLFAHVCPLLRFFRNTPPFWLALTLIPGQAIVCSLWPLPAELPWHEVQLDDWRQHGDHRPVQAVSSDQWYARFAKAVEHSLDGFVPSFPNGRPPSNCFGLRRQFPRVVIPSPLAQAEPVKSASGWPGF